MGSRGGRQTGEGAAFLWLAHQELREMPLAVVTLATTIYLPFLRPGAPGQSSGLMDFRGPGSWPGTWDWELERTE